MATPTQKTISQALGTPVPDTLFGIHQTIARSMRSFASAKPIARTFDLVPGQPPADLNRIVGVGIGLAETTGSFSAPPGTPVLRVYASEPMPTRAAAEYVGAVFGVQELSDGAVGFEVVPTGPIDAYQHRGRMRPVPAGISCGHVNVTAGTVGAFARGRQAPRNQDVFVLSNNHVLADVNAGVAGDAVLQPGKRDGGRDPADRFAELERFVQIDFSPGATNAVDAAVAKVIEPASVRSEMLFLQNGLPAFFPYGKNPVPAHFGMTVGKSGRTTGLTVGRVTATGVTIQVNMRGGRIAVFDGQIEIAGLQGLFSQPGDSGSLIWTWANPHDPVGLLFAGGNNATFANPIDDVLAALDVNLL
jgi:hypothetical protein